MPNMQVTSGIQPKAMMSPQAATAPYTAMQPKNPMQQQLYGQFAAPMRTKNMRDMSQQNANYNLGGQMQRANSGLQWGQIGNQQYQQDATNQVQNRNMATGLLQQLLGGFQ